MQDRQNDLVTHARPLRPMIHNYLFSLPPQLPPQPLRTPPPLQSSRRGGINVKLNDSRFICLEEIHQFPMRLKVLHHNHCFDGLASAAVFSRYFQKVISPDGQIGYTGLAHKPNQKFIEEELFDGQENAIVDFKYSPSPRLNWWFDHHQSAFLSS